jgi:hypothetical protein
MATRDIMDPGKDLRRHNFPCCHVSSLPGIKLPVVALASQSAPRWFPQPRFSTGSSTSLMLRRQHEGPRQTWQREASWTCQRTHGDTFPLLTGFSPVEGLAKSGRHWHAAAPGKPARALASRSCSKSSPNSTFGDATRLFAALLFPVESCGLSERTRTSRRDQARSSSNCRHQRDWPRFPQSRG